MKEISKTQVDKNEIEKKILVLKKHIYQFKDLLTHSKHESEKVILKNIILNLKKIKTNCNKFIFILFINSHSLNEKDTKEIKELLNENKKLRISIAKFLEDLAQIIFSSKKQTTKNEIISFKPSTNNLQVKKDNLNKEKDAFLNFLNKRIEQIVSEQKKEFLDTQTCTSLESFNLSDEEILKELKEISSESEEKFALRSKKILTQEVSSLEEAASSSKLKALSARQKPLAKPSFEDHSQIKKRRV